LPLSYGAFLYHNNLSNVIFNNIPQSQAPDFPNLDKSYRLYIDTEHGYTPLTVGDKRTTVEVTTLTQSGHESKSVYYGMHITQPKAGETVVDHFIYDGPYLGWIDLRSFATNKAWRFMSPSASAINGYAFSRCAGLNHVEFRDTISNPVSINYSNFIDNTATGIEKLDLSPCIMDNSTISNYFCYGMYGIKELILPKGIATISTGNAMMNNYSLKSLTIQAGITDISTNAFLNSCYNFETLTILEEIPPAFRGFSSSVQVDQIKIYVPAGCGDAYKAASGWSTYADKIYELKE
jgi:hypothetical protein